LPEKIMGNHLYKEGAAAIRYNDERGLVFDSSGPTTNRFAAPVSSRVLVSPPFEVAAWIRQTWSSDWKAGSIIGQWGASTGWRLTPYRTDSTQYHRFEVYGNGAFRTTGAAGVTDYVQDEWYLVHAWFADQYINLAFNGGPALDSDWGGTVYGLPTGESFIIQPQGNNPLFQVGDIYLWNRVLTQKERQSLYTDQWQLYRPLVPYQIYIEEEEEEEAPAAPIVILPPRSWKRPGPPTVPFTLNRDSPQARGLVGWWTCFGQNRGQIALRDMMRHAHMTAYNSPTIVSSEMGPAIGFDDGADQYLRYPVAPITAHPLSMVCWFWSDDLTINQAMMGISSEDDNSFHGFWLMARGAEAGDPIAARTFGGGAARQAATSTGYSANTIHLAVGVFVSTIERYAYIDGGNKGTSTGSSSAPSSLDNVTLGSVYYWNGSANVVNSPLSGGIIEARLYNRALTDADVAALYDPATRWDLYRPMVPYLIAGGVAAAPGGPTNEDVSLALARLMTLTDAASAASLAAASLARTLTVGRSALAAAIGAMSLARQAATSQGGQAVSLGSVSLGRQAAIADGASAASIASTTLARQAALADGSTAASLASLNLNIVKAATQAATAAAAGSITLTNQRGISQSATAATAAAFTTAIYQATGLATGLTASLTLTRSSASTMAAQAASIANLTLAETLAASLAASAAGSSNINLARVLQVTAAALAAASATISVTRSLSTSWVGTESGAAAAAVVALTLTARSLDLTLEERSLALTLVARAME
jgi:hypothetical protein